MVEYSIFVSFQMRLYALAYRGSFLIRYLDLQTHCLWLDQNIKNLRSIHRYFLLRIFVLNLILHMMHWKCFHKYYQMMFQILIYAKLHTIPNPFSAREVQFCKVFVSPIFECLSGKWCFKHEHGRKRCRVWTWSASFKNCS